MDQRKALEVQRAFFNAMPGTAFDERWVEMVKPSEFNLAGRDKILRLEAAIGALPQYVCPVKHYFADGLYVREIFIPAGCALVGYIHTQECVTTVSKGAIIIADGEHEPIAVTAPFTKTCAAGTKKAGFALQDTIWTDSYANRDNERDIDTLERRLTANTHAEYLAGVQKRLESRL